jgi:class 3 adenylate cyclase
LTKKAALLNKDKEIQQAEISRQKFARNVFSGGFCVVLLFAGVFFVQRNRISKERNRSEHLLLNILPAEVAEELKEKGSAETKLFDNVTVLFTDFKDFTHLSERLAPDALVAELHHCFKAFDEIMAAHGIEKIKTIGDAYMAVSGLPTPNESHAEAAVMAAFEMRNFIMQRRNELGEATFEMRTGLHSGKVVAGIVGVKKFAYDIWGDTVNTAARMEQAGVAGKVNISETTYQLVKDKFQCTYRGKVAAKNKGEVDMYFAEPLNAVQHELT